MNQLMTKVFESSLWLRQGLLMKFMHHDVYICQLITNVCEAALAIFSKDSPGARTYIGGKQDRLQLIELKHYY